MHVPIPLVCEGRSPGPLEAATSGDICQNLSRLWKDGFLSSRQRVKTERFLLVL